ncbi:MAG: dihydrolipoyllysine-residue acetyltransferase [Proteobacteria bacterium]|nr:dihydrolipoyllysine-residue acetyltransferase [Pseudomonadota bacterium]
MGQMHEAKVPDIGNFHDIPVIELLVAVGDTVKADQGLVTLESDKATMEVPAPLAGVVKELKVKLGDRISEGGVVAVIEAMDASLPPLGEGGRRPDEGLIAQDALGSQAPSPSPQPSPGGRGGQEPAPQPTAPLPATPAGVELPGATSGSTVPSSPPVVFDAAALAPGQVPYASPAVRVFARELGVDLHKVKGSARAGRITKADVQAFVKGALQAAPIAVAASGGGLNLIPWPKVDFGKFGEVESRPLSRIQKLSGANLLRNWAMIPHVTQHDEADITAMEAFRKQLGATHKDVKVTPLVFLIKAAVAALRKYPAFNSSLDGDSLILKKYFHIGIAVDTPSGLVVPVIRDADRKGLLELSHELAAISAKAREGKLTPADMSGGCFSISSLGGIGGTAFTPIINAPEVAILGVSKSRMQPLWTGEGFEPRLMLPLSLSYDHRVIDGAAAARFAAYLAQVLGDLRLLLL